MSTFSDRLAHELGDAVRSMRSVSGGDMAEAFRVELADDRTLFAKTHSDPPAGFFSREASDLSWLAEPAALPVPKVVAVSDDRPAFLVLEWIDVARVGGDEAAFGRALAELHLAGAPCFGREDRRTTGSLALPNDPCETWAEFTAERRLRPLSQLAFDRGALTPSVCDGIEVVASKLEQLGGPSEPPARLHGDLWAGNRVIDGAGRSWLVDPAAHGGHREFDLAMMRLFGGFGEEAFHAYDERFPLADGWADRIRLHQLVPLIVHAIKFGGGYAGAVADVVRSAGG